MDTVPNDIDILLVFCPLFQTTEPHLAVAHLAAYLAGRGHRAEARDLSLDFFRKIREPSVQYFIRTLLLEKERRLRAGPFRQIDYYEYLRTHIGLAALQSLLMEGSRPIRLENWNAVCRRAFAVQAAFGFDTVVQNDLREFLDDLYAFNGVTDFPRDLRLGFVRRTTIAETVTPNRLFDWETNLYLRVYERLFLSDLLQKHPLVIGLSVATNEQIVQALSLAVVIKHHAPDIHITAGGSYVRYLESDELAKLLAFGVFDSLARGRGETSLPPLVEALKGHRKPNGIPDLLEPGPHGEEASTRCTQKTTTRGYWDIVPNYTGLEGLLSGTTALGVYASEGCFWGKCTYCNYTGIRGGECRPPFKPPHVLVNELIQLQRQQCVDQFNLISNSIPPTYANQVSDLILEKNIHCELSMWARGESGFDRPLCEKMRRAGFRYVTLGIESLCERVLRMMNKGTTVATNLDTLHHMVDAGILVQVNIILGFHGETPAEAEETFKRVTCDVQNLPNSRIVIFPFSVQRGSAIYHDPTRFGVVLRNATESDFRPKNIFVPFNYLGETSFEAVHAMAMRYQGPFFSARAPQPKPAYYVPPEVDHSCVDFTLRNQRIERSPSYLFVNFDSGVAKQVSPALGYVLAGARPEGGRLGVLPPTDELLSLNAARIIV